MRTVLARLVALGALLVVVGCSGNSTTPLPISGGINGSGGGQGGLTGNTTGGTGGTAPASVTDTRNLLIPAGATGITFQHGPTAAGWQYNVIYLTSAGFVLTPSASGTITEALTTQLTPFTGVTAFALPAPVVGSNPPAVLQYGQLNITSGSITGTRFPQLQISNVNQISGRTNVTLAALNGTTWTTVTTCTVTSNVINCPAATFAGWPATGTGVVNFVIYSPS